MTMRLLDSNVWLAAVNADEEDHVPARRLVEGAITRPLAALDLTLYEVANVAMKRWRSPERAREVAMLVRDACPGRIGTIDAALLERAIARSTEHKLTIYDAVYVAAAELNGWTLVSGDHADLVEPGLAITAEQALAAG
jgi:predicted nucleic acid-binding protein